MLSHLVDGVRLSLPGPTASSGRSAPFASDSALGRGVPMMAAALSAYAQIVQQIVVIEGRRAGGQEGLEQALGRRYLPYAIQLRLTSARQRGSADSCRSSRPWRPFTGASVYVCRDRTCRARRLPSRTSEGALAS
jgi:hypothetical protein